MQNIHYETPQSWTLNHRGSRFCALKKAEIPNHRRTSTAQYKSKGTLETCNIEITGDRNQWATVWPPVNWWCSNITHMGFTVFLFIAIQFFIKRVKTACHRDNKASWPRKREAGVRGHETGSDWRMDLGFDFLPFFGGRRLIPSTTVGLSAAVGVSKFTFLCFPEILENNPQKAYPIS